MSSSGERTEAPGEHGVTQERFAEIVGRVAESDDICSEPAGDAVHGAAAEAAAEIASMIGLFFEKPERGIIFDVSPLDAALREIVAEGMNGSEKFTLFHGEGANRKIDGS